MNKRDAQGPKRRKLRMRIFGQFEDEALLRQFDDSRETLSKITVVEIVRETKKKKTKAKARKKTKFRSYSMPSQ